MVINVCLWRVSSGQILKICKFKSSRFQKATKTDKMKLIKLQNCHNIYLGLSPVMPKDFTT